MELDRRRQRTRQARAELRAWIDRRGLSDGACADQLGISRAYLSQILHGDRRPSVDMLTRMMDVTGIPIRAWASGESGEVAEKHRKIA